MALPEPCRGCGAAAPRRRDVPRTQLVVLGLVQGIPWEVDGHWDALPLTGLPTV